MIFVVQLTSENEAHKASVALMANASVSMGPNAELSARPPTVGGRAVAAMLPQRSCGTARSSIADRSNDS
jgi:hypothetical protein